MGSGHRHKPPVRLPPLSAGTFKVSRGVWFFLLECQTLNLASLKMECLRLARGAEERGGKCSSVINISSVSGGPTCTQSGPAYAATKAALSHFTKYTACEWAPQKIRVNAVSPWYIHTRRTEAILSDANFWAAVRSRTPMRKVGEPTDVANAVAFLASDAASFISGSVLHVDGGFASSGFGFFDDHCIPTPTTP